MIQNKNNTSDTISMGNTAPAPDVCEDLNSATGQLAIRMTNDYLFRALLQSNNHVLKGLISSLLDIPIDKVRSVIINNPIILGEAINEKTFFLDIALTLNDNTLINLEMQVILTSRSSPPFRLVFWTLRFFRNIPNSILHINS